MHELNSLPKDHFFPILSAQWKFTNESCTGHERILVLIILMLTILFKHSIFLPITSTGVHVLYKNIF